MSKAHYIHWFAELGIDDVPLVDGKNASLRLNNNMRVKKAT